MLSRKPLVAKAGNRWTLDRCAIFLLQIFLHLV